MPIGTLHAKGKRAEDHNIVIYFDAVNTLSADLTHESMPSFLPPLLVVCLSVGVKPVMKL
ncbi:hypothetical protein TMatcc_000154 [Talaromyces marneffei ATCC 18224]